MSKWQNIKLEKNGLRSEIISVSLKWF